MHGLINPQLKTAPSARQSMGADPDSVFHQEWWAQAASPGTWAKVTCHRDNDILAEFTYSTNKRFGFTEIGHPFMARTMEPRIWLPPAKPVTQLTNLVAIIKEIREQLPPHSLFWCNLPPGTSLGLPYELAGYSVETSYTFRSVMNAQHAWDGMDQKTRNRVRAAQRNMHVEKHQDIERFIALSKRFIGARNRLSRLDYDAIRRIFSACVLHKAGHIISTVDEDGVDQASAILINDENYAYFWMSARDPASRLGSAISLLIWNAISWSIDRHLVFDMDGYASPSAGIFYGKFGLIPTQRTHIRWASDTYKLLNHSIGMTRKLALRA